VAARCAARENNHAPRLPPRRSATQNNCLCERARRQKSPTNPAPPHSRVIMLPFSTSKRRPTRMSISVALSSAAGTAVAWAISVRDGTQARGVSNLMAILRARRPAGHPRPHALCFRAARPHNPGLCGAATRPGKGQDIIEAAGWGGAPERGSQLVGARQAQVSCTQVPQQEAEAAVDGRGAADTALGVQHLRSGRSGVRQSAMYKVSRKLYLRRAPG